MWKKNTQKNVILVVKNMKTKQTYDLKSKKLIEDVVF